MAEIPVEHKKAAAFPWWLIPLILLLLLLPLALLLQSQSDNGR